MEAVICWVGISLTLGVNYLLDVAHFITGNVIGGMLNYFNIWNPFSVPLEVPG